MNPKPLFISSLIVTLLTAMALEGGALSLGQAIAVLAPASVLLLWSFMQTDWYEPVGKEGEIHDTSTMQEMSQGSAGPR